MTDPSPAERVETLEQKVAALSRELAQLREYMAKQVELNRKLASAFAKSAQTTATINEAQQKLAKQQDLFFMIASAKLFAGPAELRALLLGIAANPDTPKPFAEAASDLSNALATATPDREKPRWIPEIVAGTDLEKG